MQRHSPLQSASINQPVSQFDPYNSRTPTKNLKSRDSPEKNYGSPSSPTKPEYHPRDTYTKTYDSPKRDFGSSGKKSRLFNNANFGEPIEIIKDKLFWMADSKPPQNIENAYFFNIDEVSPFFP